METSMTPTHKHRKLVWVACVGLVIASLVAALVWCWLYRDHSSPAPATSSTPGAATSTTGPCNDGSSNPAPAGFTFYENASLGFRFAYPTSWGSVSVATIPMGGTSGHYLLGSFSSNADVTFGGNGTDYIVNARDGIPTDNPGYLIATNKYYTVQIWKLHEGSTDTPKYDLYPIEEASVLKPGCNAKALITQYPMDEFFGYSYDLVRFNLRSDNLYYGVNFVSKNPTAASRTDVDKLVKSFQLIP